MSEDRKNNVFIRAINSLYSFFDRSYVGYKEFDKNIQEDGSSFKKACWAAGKSGVLISCSVATLAFIEFSITAAKFGIDGSNLDKTTDFISGLPNGNEFFNVVNLLNVIGLVMIVNAGYLLYKSRKEEGDTVKKINDDDYLFTPNEEDGDDLQKENL